MKDSEILNQIHTSFSESIHGWIPLYQLKEILRGHIESFEFLLGTENEFVEALNRGVSILKATKFDIPKATHTTPQEISANYYNATLENLGHALAAENPSNQATVQGLLCAYLHAIAVTLKVEIQSNYSVQIIKYLNNEQLKHKSQVKLTS